MTDILIGDQIYTALLFFCKDEPAQSRREPGRRGPPAHAETLAYVQANPGADTLRVADALQLKHRTAQMYLDKLVERGVVRKASGRPNKWWPV